MGKKEPMSYQSPVYLALCLMYGALANSVPSFAGPFESDIDLFRLGSADKLTINRGGPVANAGDVNGDGLADVIVGSGTGSVRVVFGPTNGDNGYLDTTIQRGVGGFAITGGASAVGGGGDVNGDGLDDVVIGSERSTHVIFGRRGGFPATVVADQLNGSDGFTVESAGQSVSIIGDMNGDGIDEVVIGSRHRDAPGFRDAGRVTVLFGQSQAFPSRLSPLSINSTLGFTVYGEATLDLLGWSVDSAGDINNDGLKDLVIGATGINNGGLSEVGRTYIIYGSESLPTLIKLDALSSRGLIFQGRSLESVTGYSAQSAGDINGDGISDLLIGAPGKGSFGQASNFPGEIYVLFGSRILPNQLAVEDLDGNRGFVIRGIRGGTVPEIEGQIAWGDQAGFSVSGAGDVNGDGRDDIVIGAPYTIISNARRGNGQVYIVYGRSTEQPFPQQLSLAELDGENGFRWIGTGTTDYTGFSVSQAGDFNDDGVDDVIVGASGQGESFILYGRAGNVFP